MSAWIILLILAVVFGFYVAWNIGANDVANAVGTAVGSKALTLKQAVIIAAIFEFAGAFLLGGNVAETVEGRIVNASLFSHDATDYVYGMLASLLAAGVWLQVASFFGWPVSTTHSIVGAVAGFGLIVGGFGAIYWGAVGSIAASWVISPLLGGGLAYLIFSLIRWKIFYKGNPLKAAKKVVPYFVFAFFFILSLIIGFGGLKNLNLDLNVLQALGIAALVALVTATLSKILLSRLKGDEEEGTSLPNPEVSIGLKKVQKHLGRVEAASLGSLHDSVDKLLSEVKQLQDKIDTKDKAEIESFRYARVEKIFVCLQIVSACFLAFAHGSNDVANAIGPLSAIFNTLKGQKVWFADTVSSWMLVLGGIGIIIGLATWGWRVIETVGKKITELTPSRGFAAEFGAATTIVLASKLGLPISTTHTLVGAVLGVGFARGIGALNLNVVRDIAISWVVTVPAGAFLSVIFFYALRFLFSL